MLALAFLAGAREEDRLPEAPGPRARCSGSGIASRCAASLGGSARVRCSCEGGLVSRRSRVRSGLRRRAFSRAPVQGSRRACPLGDVAIFLYYQSDGAFRSRPPRPDPLRESRGSRLPAPKSSEMKPRGLALRGFLIFKARWQSGHAAACKAVYAGSIPTLAWRVARPEGRI
jgi:hypothetical protein